jgi:uncharacterized protein (TIGR00369 family)
MTDHLLAMRLQPLIDQPLHRLLGMAEVESREGAGHLAIAVSAMSSSPAGGLHGGVIYLLSDVCAMVGLLSRLPADQFAVTHDIHVSVMRSAALGDRVTFDSRITQLGRRLCFCEVVVQSGGKTLATARVTKSLVPAPEAMGRA